MNFSLDKKKIIIYILNAVFLTFCTICIIINFKPGKDMLKSYWGYIKYVLSAVPAIFIIIGLFKIWVNNKTVKKHMGTESGIKGYILAIILAFQSIGGLFTSLPIAKEINSKGARLSVVITYLGASCVCRIPMTLWEASLLGIKFTLTRYLISLPLIIISSILLEKAMKINNIKETNNEKDDENRSTQSTYSR